MKSTLIAWIEDAPLVIAHRGASFAAPENTLAAFRLAREMGADAIEFDAKCSRDGAVVIHHDRTLQRTTDGHGSVSAYTLKELKQLDAGAWFGAGFRGEKIPTLEEVIQVVGSSLLLNIEITNYAHPRNDLPQRVIDIVTRHGLEDRVLLSSFNPRALQVVRSLAPHLAVGLLLMPQQPALLRMLLRWRVARDAYHPHLNMLDERATQQALEAGPVNVWTVNTLDWMQSCLEAGVSGIITDRPDLARTIIQ